MIESTDDLGTGKDGLAKRWTMELDNAHRLEKTWRDQAQKVMERYRLSGKYKTASGQKFNILWSNTETLKPAIYSQTPTPDIRRRFSDTDDDQADRISTALERALSFSMDSYAFDTEVQRVRDDYLLPGRGVARVRYIPTMSPVKRKVPVDLQDDGTYQRNGETVDQADLYLESGQYFTYTEQDELTYEEARCEYVHWEDLRISPAKIWPDVTWVAFRQLMTRDDLVKYFGKAGSDVSLTISSSTNSYNAANKPEDNQTIFNKAELWEIWDKETRKVYWYSEGYNQKILKTIDDPLDLDQFFPIPEPLYSIKSNDTLVPVPEYVMYQDQAEELDILTTRLTKLVDALRAKFLYAGEQKQELDNLFKADENCGVPVGDWVSFSEKGGIDGMISWLPVEQFGKVISALYQKRNELIQTIYDLTGISDIMRGSSDPRETKGAQELKAQFGSRRTMPRARDFQYFIRDLLRLKTEIMCNHFSAMTFYQQTGVQLTPDDMKLMRNDAMRAFKIDIETDSTVAPYDDAEKQNVSEFLQATASFAADLAPLVQLGVYSPEMVGETISWAAGKFKVSRDLQQRLKQTGQVTDPAAAQQQQQAQQQQMAQQQQQHDQALAQQQQAHDQNLNQMKQEHQQQLDMADLALKQKSHELDMIIKQQQAGQDMRIKEAVAQNNIRIANKQAEAKGKH